MMIEMNNVSITGRLTKDPEVHTTRSGESVVSFSLVVRRPKTRNVVDLVDFVAWDDTAEFIGRTFKKGDKLEVTGSVTTREYEKEGIRRKVTEIRVDEVSYCNDAPNYKKSED